MSTAEKSSQNSNWGRWGAADERGALNLLTPERVLAATQIIQTGQVYSLGLPIQRTGVPIYDYRGAPYRVTLTNDQDAHRWVSVGAPSGTGANADMIMAATHNGTHLDALCHVFTDHAIYNGFPSSSFTPSDGASRCGIEKAGPIVARAVILDIAGAAGVSYLQAGSAITADLIVAAEQRQRVTIGVGDIVLLHTGWLRYFIDQAAAGQAVPLDRQPGLGPSGAELLVERDIAAVGADNTAVEALAPELPFIPLHLELIVRRGISFLELVDLREPVADGISTGLLVVAPLAITGGSGSPVNPVLIV